jgi:hypothetical protein
MQKDWSHHDNLPVLLGDDDPDEFPCKPVCEKEERKNKADQHLLYTNCIIPVGVT